LNIQIETDRVNIQALFTRAPLKSMQIHTLCRRQFVAGHIEEVFAFFSRAENLQEITPAWLNFQILSVDPPELRKGTLIRYGLAWRGLLPLRWTTEITRWQPPFCFVDEQTAGPYRLWHHEHRLQPQGTGTLMIDTVKYAMPLGPAGAVAHRFIVQRDVERIFDFRARATKRLFG
jgi:ligand-binding SRPBCC domain-containing protein